MEKSRTVLLVEDEAEIRACFAEVLEEEGYAVLQAKNGREALDLLAARPASPCVIVLDLMMPVMDGFQFRAEQLRDVRLATIPVVVVSADANVQAKGAALNAQGVLNKPVRLEVFVREVDRLCRLAA